MTDYQFSPHYSWLFNGRLKKRSKWGEKNGLWSKFLFWSICRNATPGEMLTYLLDKTEHLSLPVCYKTLNIWAGVTVTGNSSWLRPFQPSWVMKAIKTIQLWKFPWGFHLWHPQSFWALQTQMKQQILFKRGEWRWFTQKRLQGLSTDSFSHLLLSEDICADFSNFFLLPVTTFDWLHQLHSVQSLRGTIKAVSRQHRKCGGFYRYPFMLHKQSPNDT